MTFRGLRGKDTLFILKEGLVLNKSFEERLKGIVGDKAFYDGDIIPVVEEIKVFDTFTKLWDAWTGRPVHHPQI